MQLIPQNIQIIEKVIKNESGVFLIRLAVLNTGGSFQYKVIDCQEITEQAYEFGSQSKGYEFQNKILLLEAPVLKQVYEFVKALVQESVYIFNKTQFFISQPIRAPGF